MAYLCRRLFWSICLSYELWKDIEEYVLKICKAHARNIKRTLVIVKIVEALIWL